MHMLAIHACIYTSCMHMAMLPVNCHATCVHACMQAIILFFLQTMKIVLVVVVLVACFAAVKCQDAICLSNGLTANGGSLLSCSTAFAVSSPILHATCTLQIEYPLTQ